jgi:hypothetical protein
MGRKRRKDTTETPLDQVRVTGDELPEDGSSAEPQSKRHEGVNTRASIQTWWERSSYIHLGIGGPTIRPSFVQLNTRIIIAADVLLADRKEETGFGNLDEYGMDDFQFLRTMPFRHLEEPPKKRACFQFTRMVIGWFVFKQILETPFMAYDKYISLIEDALEHICDIKSTCSILN